MAQTNQTKNSASSSLQSKNDSTQKNFQKMGVGSTFDNDFGDITFEDPVVLRKRPMGDVPIQDFDLATQSNQTKNS